MGKAVLLKDLMDAMLASHNKPAVVITPPAPEEELTEHQQKVVDVFNKWNYGCQHNEVRELVAAILDVPESFFKDKRESSYYVYHPVHSKSPLLGRFVTLTNKESDRTRTSKLKKGEVLFLPGFNCSAIRADGTTTDTIEHFKFNSIEELTKGFPLSKKEEIDQFFTVLTSVTSFYEKRILGVKKALVEAGILPQEA